MRASRRVCAASSVASESLLGYALRRAAACEMLYGGVRVQHLLQKPFPLHRIRSEQLPSPSLQRERDDLGLEMQLPRDLQGYGNVNMAVQRHVGRDAPEFDIDGDGDDTASAHGRDTRSSSPHGFDLGSYMAAHHHPDRHHTSMLPYTAHDTSNVLALRLLPINVNIRARTEVAQLRTRDCLARLRDAKLCAQAGVALQYPLSFAQRHHYAQQTATHETLYTPSPDDPHKPASATTTTTSAATTTTTDARSTHGDALRYAHLHGGPHHPPSSALSIVTRPVDCDADDDDNNNNNNNNNNNGSNSRQDTRVASARGDGARRWRGVGGHRAGAMHPMLPRQYWMPLQMLKPVASTWSPALRGAGARNPRGELYQERIDRKGFGQKRKARSLWQQDIHTHGFRPNRYY